MEQQTGKLKRSSKLAPRYTYLAPSGYVGDGSDLGKAFLWIAFIVVPIALGVIAHFATRGA